MLTKYHKLQLRKHSKNTLIKMIDSNINTIYRYMTMFNDINSVIKSEKILEEKIKEIDAILHPEVKTEVK